MARFRGKVKRFWNIETIRYTPWAGVRPYYLDFLPQLVVSVKVRHLKVGLKGGE